MNIRGILLGSTAALIAASGARAADAVIAPEPEPVEYVRVCDVYGTSFYYIPGTEICLKVGGYFRYDIGYGDLFGDVGDEGDMTWHKRQRFQLRMDARSETELGTLRGYLALNINFETGSASPDDGSPTGWDDSHDASNSEDIEHAYVELGGFRIGVTDSLFDTETGYASDVVNDGLIDYGPDTTHQIAYTYDFGNGFAVSAALEEGSDGLNYTTYQNGFIPGTTTPYFQDSGAVNDYAPHVVVGAAYSGGLFGVSAVGAWDSNQDEFAVKGRIDVNPTDMIALFVMGAYTDDDNENGGNYYANWGGEWAFWAGGSATFNDRIKANVEFGINELSDYSIDADVNLTVVPGFVVTPGIGYTHGDGDPLSYIAEGDTWGGYVRTQFTF